MQINTILAQWNISDPACIAETPTSHVYKVRHDNQTRILKVYTDLGRSCEGDAPYFFEACNTQETARIFAFNHDAMLMEYIDGVTLKQWMADHSDEAATHIIGRILKSIHANQRHSDYNFQTLEKRFEALFTHAQRDCPDIVKRAAIFARHMLNQQNDICLLHGDIHHENLLQRQGGWVAIDPQPLIGDRAYDCANTLHNPHQMPGLTEDKNRLLKQADILSAETQIPAQKIINFAFIHGCLSTCWSEDDKTDTFSKCLAIRTSEILEPFITQE